MILDHIEMARETGLPYVYLGYWVPGSAKMDYKARFKGVEIFRDRQWRQLDPEDDFSRDKNLCEIKSISEQVAQIAMPEVRHSHET
jgi:arginine-tRNA-protein transferase